MDQAEELEAQVPMAKEAEAEAEAEVGEEEEGDIKKGEVVKERVDKEVDKEFDPRPGGGWRFVYRVCKRRGSIDSNTPEEMGASSLRATSDVLGDRPISSFKGFHNASMLTLEVIPSSHEYLLTIPIQTCQPYPKSDLSQKGRNNTDQEKNPGQMRRASWT